MKENLPKAETFRPEIYGIAYLNVTTTVTPGGPLHVDVTGVDNGTYVLIEVDTITWAFATVAAADNDAKDLTIAISGTQVTVSDGGGAITGGKG